MYLVTGIIRVGYKGPNGTNGLSKNLMHISATLIVKILSKFLTKAFLSKVLQIKISQGTSNFIDIFAKDMPRLIDPNSNKKDRKDRKVKETEKIENTKMIVKIYLKKKGETEKTGENKRNKRNRAKKYKK